MVMLMDAAAAASDQTMSSPNDESAINFSAQHQGSLEEEQNEDKSSGQTVVATQQQEQQQKQQQQSRSDEPADKRVADELASEQQSSSDGEDQRGITAMLVSRGSSLDEEHKLSMNVDDESELKKQQAKIGSSNVPSGQHESKIAMELTGDPLVARMRDIVGGINQSGQQQLQHHQQQQRTKSSSDSLNNNPNKINSKTSIDSVQQRKSRHTRATCGRHHHHHHHHQHQHTHRQSISIAPGSTNNGGGSGGGRTSSNPHHHHHHHHRHGQRHHAHSHHHHHHHHHHAQHQQSRATSSRRNSIQRQSLTQLDPLNASCGEIGADRQPPKSTNESKSSTSSISSSQAAAQQQGRISRKCPQSNPDQSNLENKPSDGEGQDIKPISEGQCDHHHHHGHSHHHHHGNGHHHHHHHQPKESSSSNIHSQSHSHQHHSHGDGHHHHHHHHHHCHHRSNKKRLVLDADNGQQQSLGGGSSSTIEIQKEGTIASLSGSNPTIQAMLEVGTATDGSNLIEACKREPLQEITSQSNVNPCCPYHDQHSSSRSKQHCQHSHPHYHHHHHHQHHQHHHPAQQESQSNKDIPSSEQQASSARIGHHHHHHHRNHKHHHGHHHGHHHHHHHHGHQNKQRHRSKQRSSSKIDINEQVDNVVEDIVGVANVKQAQNEQSGNAETTNDKIVTAEHQSVPVCDSSSQPEPTPNLQTATDPTSNETNKMQFDSSTGGSKVQIESPSLAGDCSSEKTIDNRVKMELSPEEEVGLSFPVKDSDRGPDLVNSMKIQSKIAGYEADSSPPKESDISAQGASSSELGESERHAHGLHNREQQLQEGEIRMTQDGTEKQLVKQMSSHDGHLSQRSQKDENGDDGGGADNGRDRGQHLSECSPLQSEAYQRTSQPKHIIESSVPPDRRCRLCWCCCCPCSATSSARPEMAKPSSESSNSPVNKCPTLPNTSLEEIRSWGDSFDRLMKCTDGRKVFQDFLRCEYSEENILFWAACEELKSEKDAKSIATKARDIYEDYISILSSKEVSLDSRVRDVINNNIKKPTTSIFDEAQLQIYTLMHRDSYPRFINSQMYKKLAQIQTSSRKSSS